MSKRTTRSYVDIRAPGPIGNSPGTKITVDGTDITNEINSLSLHMGLNDLHSMDVTYLCHKGVRFSGDVEVHHYCPISEDDEWSSS